MATTERDTVAIFMAGHVRETRPPCAKGLTREKAAGGHCPGCAWPARHRADGRPLVGRRPFENPPRRSPPAGTWEGGRPGSQEARGRAREPPTGRGVHRRQRSGGGPRAHAAAPRRARQAPDTAGRPERAASTVGALASAPIYMHFLLVFQEVILTSKTRNQLYATLPQICLHALHGKE
jgi:hypothetical protein